MEDKHLGGSPDPFQVSRTSGGEEPPHSVRVKSLAPGVERRLAFQQLLNCTLKAESTGISLPKPIIQNSHTKEFRRWEGTVGEGLDSSFRGEDLDSALKSSNTPWIMVPALLEWLLPCVQNSASISAPNILSCIANVHSFLPPC